MSRRSGIPPRPGLSGAFIGAILSALALGWAIYSHYDNKQSSVRPNARTPAAPNAAAKQPEAVVGALSKSDRSSTEDGTPYYHVQLRLHESAMFRSRVIAVKAIAVQSHFTSEGETIVLSLGDAHSFSNGCALKLIGITGGFVTLLSNCANELAEKAP